MRKFFRRIPKPYLWVALGLFVAAWFGLIGPAMISANEDALVIGWILLTTAGAVYALNKFLKRIK